MRFFSYLFLRVCRPVFRGAGERSLRKLFGSELWVSSVCVRLWVSSVCVRSLFFCVVLLRFFLIMWIDFSPKSSLEDYLLVRCAF